MLLATPRVARAQLNASAEALPISSRTIETSRPALSASTRRRVRADFVGVRRARAQQRSDRSPGASQRAKQLRSAAAREGGDPPDSKSASWRLRLTSGSLEAGMGGHSGSTSGYGSSDVSMARPRCRCDAAKLPHGYEDAQLWERTGTDHAAPVLRALRPRALVISARWPVRRARADMLVRACDGGRPIRREDEHRDSRGACTVTHEHRGRAPSACAR